MAARRLANLRDEISELSAILVTFIKQARARAGT